MVRSFAATDVGKKRQVNQDYVYTSDTAVGILPNLYIVADGMGGHKAGDYASSFTTRFIVDKIGESTEGSPIQIMRNAIELSNTSLINESVGKPELLGMGTTIVVATICDDYLYVANVGVSRLYLINNGIVQITRDHSLVEEMVLAGKINKEEARIHPDKNIITRAIGAENKVRVDFFDMRLKEGDIILMCTDGLSNMVKDKDILSIVEEAGDIEEMGKSLILRANENGGRDNIGVVIVQP